MGIQRKEAWRVGGGRIGQWSALWASRWPGWRRRGRGGRHRQAPPGRGLAPVYRAAEELFLGPPIEVATLWVAPVVRCSVSVCALGDAVWTAGWLGPSALVLGVRGHLRGWLLVWDDEPDGAASQAVVDYLHRLGRTG